MKIPLRRALELAVGPANVDAAAHAVADWFEGHNCSGAADLVREALRDQLGQPGADVVPHSRPDTSLRAELLQKLATQREVLLNLCDRVDRLETRADGLTPIERVERRWAKEAAGPAVPDGREPASVVGEPSDADLLELYPLSMTDLDDAFAFARAVLARWGHQPAPPAEGEVGELVAWLRENAEDERQMCGSGGQASRNLDRAAELLQQRHPEPVPVSERLPGPEDCDENGYCWRSNTIAGVWSREHYSRHWYEFESHWLPATALPLPAGEGQTTPTNHPTNDE